MICERLVKGDNLYVERVERDNRDLGNVDKCQKYPLHLTRIHLQCTYYMSEGEEREREGKGERRGRGRGRGRGGGEGGEEGGEEGEEWRGKERGRGGGEGGEEGEERERERRNTTLPMSLSPSSLFPSLSRPMVPSGLLLPKRVHVHVHSTSVMSFHLAKSYL